MKRAESPAGNPVKAPQAGVPICRLDFEFDGGRGSWAWLRGIEEARLERIPVIGLAKDLRRFICRTKACRCGWGGSSGGEIVAARAR